jgi:hypothetical protein
MHCNGAAAAVLEAEECAVTRWINPCTAIISAVCSLFSAYLYYRTLDASLASVSIASEAYQRNLDARFEFQYVFPGDEEYVLVRNSGRVPVKSITIRRARYFIGDGEIFTVERIQDQLSKDGEKFRKLRDIGMLQSPCDFESTMGPSREFAVAALDVHENTTLEVSHFENENAVRVATTLGLAYIVEWKISYLVGPDEHLASQSFFTWLTENNTRVDLETVMGGVGVVARIRNFEENYADFLFSSSVSSNRSSNCFLSSARYPMQ